MGELIKKIGKTNIQGMELDIEINKPTAKGADYDIHIQHSTFRLDMTEGDFMDMGAAVWWARKRLLSYKNRGINDE